VIKGKKKKGLHQTPGCWSYASPPRVQQKTQKEKEPTKKSTPSLGALHRLQKNMHRLGEQMKKEKKYFQATGR
jgi:hypothetical protein